MDNLVLKYNGRYSPLEARKQATADLDHCSVILTIFKSIV